MLFKLHNLVPIEIDYTLSHPIPPDKMGALTYLIFFIQTLAQDRSYFRAFHTWHNFFYTPHPESLVSKVPIITTAFLSMMNKTEEFQDFCKNNPDDRLRQPENLKQTINIICRRDGFHLHPRTTQSADILCAFLHQILEFMKEHPIIQQDAPIIHQDPPQFLFAVGCEQELKNAFYLDPVIATFGHGLRPEFAFVQIRYTHIEFVVAQIFHFIGTVYARGRPWGTYGRYVQKPHPPLLDPQGGRSFLLFTKQETRNTFSIILTSNTKISAREQKGILHCSGATKQNKLYNLLITLHYDPVTQNVVIPREFPPEQIITLAEPTSTFLVNPHPVQPCHPAPVQPSAPVRIRPVIKEERLVQRTNVMNRTILENAAEFVTWDGILTFTGPDAPLVRRLLAYTRYAGTPLTAEIVETWTPTQKKHAIVSLLSNFKQIVCEEHILPQDVKCYGNMCFKSPPTRPDEIAIKLVDFISLDTTYTFLNSDSRPGPYEHPFELLKRAGKDAGRKFQLQKSRFNQRSEVLDPDFQILIYHMFFELIFSIFFIWNVDLLKIAINGKRFHKWLAFWQEPFPTRVNAQRALFVLLERPRPFADTLMHFTYDQEILPDVRTIVHRFFSQLRHDMMNLPSFVAHANDIIPIPQPSRPQDFLPTINPNGEENHVLSEAWIDSFADSIATIRTTPSPFLGPVQITPLTMI